MPTQPQYEALDAQGYPYMRKARFIGELPQALGGFRELLKLGGC